MGVKREIAILFLPAVANMAVSQALVSYVFVAVRPPLERIGIEITKTLMTYNFYWSIIQIIVAACAAKAMGGVSWVREQLSLDDVKGARSLALIAGLAVATVAVIWAFLFASALLYGYEYYFRTWREAMREVPLWSKLYLVAIAPFTAGICEELFWRGYGISRLEGGVGVRRAILIQAIAFGLWHGVSLHAIATAIVGYIYGRLYALRRRLTSICAAHVIADIVGFYFATFVTG